MSEVVNEINRLKIDSSLKVEDVNMTTLLFSDNLIYPKNNYTIVDNMLILKAQPQVSLELFEFVDSSRYYEFLMNLTKKDVVIAGRDRYANILDNLSDTVLVFINGYKISSDEYVVDSVNKTITLKNSYPDKTMSNIIIYTSADMVYEGDVEKDFSWDPEYNEFILKDYTIERYVFFKNGELLPSNKIQKIGNRVRLNTTIKHGVDFIEYYRMTRDCCTLVFTPEIGYLTYGPKDDRGTLIQNPYDCMVTFDNIARLVVDDIRPGFFVYEEISNGCVMITDDNFEGCSVKCLKIRKFTKSVLTSSEYFLTVPDAPSIIKYVSEYDLNGVLFKELLASFQKVLLNETYDSIQRLRNIRNINKVDSANICALINFLGLKINVTNLTLAKKHHLIEELRTFYDTVGTRASYNFYNAIKNEGKIVSIEQMFTPIKSNVTDEKETSFFNPNWGALQYVKQTVTNDETGKSYVYVWSFRFANGYTLPVIIRSNTNNPEWNFSLIEKTSSTVYDSATYDSKKRTWYNTKAKDESEEMVWVRQGKTVDRKKFLLAKKQNWDEGHLVENHPSVNTNRYEFSIGEKSLIVTDTYLNTVIGEWSIYKENVTPQVQDPIRRYVTFRTAEELGALYKQKYETEVTDFGEVSILAKDGGVNLSNTPRYEGELRYSNFPMLAKGILDRYHPTENGPVIHQDEITLSLIINSNVHMTNISENEEYECIIDENNEKIILTRYIGKDSNVVVPETISYQEKKVVDLSSIPTNLTINLYDKNGKRMKLYNYTAETNTFTYLLDETVSVNEYSYKVFDTNGNKLIENQLEDGDYTFSMLLPLENTYLSNPVIGPNEASIDCGFINDNPVDFYDFGSVAKQIDGHWISWYEWDRPKNWYPTNHVDISVDAPLDMDYNDFVTLFRDTFYEMASAVVYIHQLTQVYMFGNPDNDGTIEVQPMSLLTTPYYETEEQCFTNDYNFLPYKKATDSRPLKLVSYTLENPKYEYGEPNVHRYLVNFPTEWGELSSITQTVIPYYNSWAYVWSLKFKNEEGNVTGILPVFLDSVSLIPTWDFSYYEDFTKDDDENEIPNYNSALWIEEAKKLVNYRAYNNNTKMTWKRESSTVNVERDSVRFMNWDEGHVNSENNPTFSTNRFQISFTNNEIYVLDTYQHLSSTDLNVSVDIKKRYEYVNKISDDDETFEWTDTVNGILPCIQYNYTDWTCRQSSVQKLEGDIQISNGDSFPNFTVSCTPLIVTTSEYTGFFPKHWGKLISVTQSMANNESKNSYVYTWSLIFENGYVLPVVIRENSTEPEWNFDYVEHTAVHTYNGAMYSSSTNTWVNTTAKDMPYKMEWTRSGYTLDEKSYESAIQCNWDRGHLINGKPSVKTSRYSLILANGQLKAIDTYTDTLVGVWSSYNGTEPVETKLNWVYSLVLNYKDKDVGYIISQDLKDVKLAVQSTQLKKVQAVIDNKIECVRPNSVFYKNNQWVLGYVKYDKEHSVFQWKAITLDKNNAQDEDERFGLGLGGYDYELLRVQAEDIHWNSGRYGEVFVNSKAEIQNDMLSVYISTDKGERGYLQEYHRIDKNFPLDYDFTFQPYSYEYDNTIWSCDFKKYIINNYVTLEEETKKNSTLLLLPDNIIYEDKNTKIKCKFQNRFGNMDYQFEKLDSELNLRKKEVIETETQRDKFTYYDYINHLQSSLGSSIFSFNTYGTIISTESVVFLDTDYVVFAYHYDKGHHLDTFTRIVDSNNSDYNIGVGYYANTTSWSYPNYKIPYGPAYYKEESAPELDHNALVQWARHNRGSQESQGHREENVVINVSNFNNPQYSAYFNNIITFDLYCAFLESVAGVTSPNDVQIILRGYKGGTMVRDPNDWYRYINVDENGHENEPKYLVELPLQNLYYENSVGDSILGDSNGYKQIPEQYNAASRNKLRKGCRVYLDRIRKKFTFEIISNQDE